MTPNMVCVDLNRLWKQERFIKTKKNSELTLPRRPCTYYMSYVHLLTRVPDPDLLYVSGPLVSGSVYQRYGLGSGSFHHQAKILRKIFVSTLL
jgi:hypothetical protein